jgi:hypothetical protein
MRCVLKLRFVCLMMSFERTFYLFSGDKNDKGMKFFIIFLEDGY